MDSDIQDLIERMVKSGSSNLSKGDEDLIIWCLKHSLEILEKEWEDELKEEVFVKYKEDKLWQGTS